MNTKKILNAIIILSIIGIVTSLYLIQNHYAPPTEGSLCDFSESVSCSLVNTSTYSMLFNVPVALFGALWFLTLGLMAWKAKETKTQHSLFTGILGWNILGMLFVIYLIIAEIILEAICPLCTVVHVITLIAFVLSIILYKSFKSQVSLKKNLPKLKPWIIAIVILNLIPLILFNIPMGETEDHSPLAQCITDSGANMYGSFKCGVCAKTRSMFGDSFKYINEIECHPQGENAQTELCLSKNIEGTPTWILEPNGEEQKRHTGFLSLEELAEFSGCSLQNTETGETE